MQVDMNKESLCINKIVGQKMDNIMVESDMIVPDIKPDILNIISTTGQVCIYKKEVLEGKIRIDGEVNVYVIYLADNEQEEIRSLNTSIDFTQIIDFENCSAGMSLDEKVSISNLESRILNGRKINVKANLQFEGTIYSNENIEILKEVNNIKDIQSLQKNLVVNSLVGEGTAKTCAKDTIMIDNIDNLAEILKTEIAIKNKDIKISYNKILAKSDVCVKILYLTEDNHIKLVENTIPVMGFVDIENVTEEDICDMKYKVKNVIVKPNSQEEHSVYVEVQLELYARVYQNKEVKVIGDLYSPSEELIFKQKNINTMSDKNCTKSICNIKEKIALPEIGGNQIYDVEVTPTILERKIRNSKVMFEAELALKFMYATNNGTGINVKEMRLPFEYNIDMTNVNMNTNISTEIEVINQNFVVVSDGLIDTSIDLGFILDVSNMIQIDIIDEVSIDETRNKEIYSIVIYFVKSGDTLWNIAKRYGSTVSDILRVNNIEDENKIYPGQQLFIPKYVFTTNFQSA